MASGAFASAAARKQRIRARDHNRVWENTQRRPIVPVEESYPEFQAHSRTSQRTQTRAKAMEPFSHIQVVPQASQDNSKDHDSPVFRRPSFADQLRNPGMAGYGISTGAGAKAGGGPPAVPATLANMTSGTTFAAAARAAELNAARSNKQKAREAASQKYAVPDIEPLALGALTFTKSRLRGSKAGKTPSDLPDLSEHGNMFSNQAGPGPRTEDQDAKRAVTSTSYGNSQMPFSTTQNPIEKSDPVNVHPQLRRDSTKWDPGAPSFEPAEMHTNKMKENVSPFPEKKLQAQQPSMGSKAPSTASTATSRYRHDDPFTEQLAISQSSGQRTGFQGQMYPLPSSQYQSQQHEPMPSGQYNAYSGQKQAMPAAKGDMDFNFRFPQGQSSMNAQSQSGHFKPSTDTKPIVVPVPAVPKQTQPTAAGSYQRDPKPYSSYATSTSKRDMILQNLNNMIESEGKGPAPTRTVLYDPVARQGDNQSRVSNRTYNRHSERDSESLQSSEPLPWKDRPVDIFNPYHQGGQDFREPPSFPPGLAQGNEYIYRLAQQPKRAERSLDELERWWRTDNRAKGVSRAHMDLINQIGRQPTITPTRHNMPSSMESFSSPASARTGSSIPPIGSERAQNKAATEQAATAGGGYTSISPDGMTELMKAAFVNLASYVDGSDNDDYFGRFARPPEWCIDKSPGGNDSFFGDWGSPPSRVGRDPRYRPTYHEGRYTVFEELDRRGGREPAGRRLR